MTDREDHRLVELLYDEASTEDAPGRKDRPGDDGELSSFEAMLGVIRSVPADDPPAHLDAKIMAAAREAADAADAGWWSRLLRASTSPRFGLAVAGAMAVGVAVVVLPVAVLQEPRSEVVAVRALEPDVPMAPSSAGEPVLPPNAQPAPTVAAEDKRVRQAPARARRKEVRAPAARSPQPDGRSAPPTKSPKPAAKSATKRSAEARDSSGRGQNPLAPGAPARRSARPPGVPRPSTPAEGLGDSKRDVADAESALSEAPRPSPSDADRRPGREASRAGPAEEGEGGDPMAFVRAAAAKEEKGQVTEARRIYAAAERRFRGAPAHATVLIRFAQFELRHRNYPQARDLAAEALRRPQFRERAAARKVIEAAEAALR